MFLEQFVIYQTGLGVLLQSSKFKINLFETVSFWPHLKFSILPKSLNGSEELLKAQQIYFLKKLQLFLLMFLPRF